MKLYSFAPQDCSGKVRWLLNEMNVEFEDKKLSYKNKDHLTDEYQAKHPLTQVPVLEDENVTLYESYAIVAYLADKYVDKSFAPPVSNSKDRALYYQWMFFSSVSADNFFTKYRRLDKMTEEYKKEWGEYIQDKTQKVFKTIEAQLEGNDYILGAFSAVDTCLGYEIHSMRDDNIFNDYPKTKAYYERLGNREACKQSAIFSK